MSGHDMTWLADYERDGFAVFPAFVDRDSCDALRARADQIIAAAPAREQVSVFTTHEQERVSDEWFLSSGGEVRLFHEPDGTTVNKIGHALHDRDALFAAFSRDPRLATLSNDLGIAKPLLLQSMYLLKAPRSGGEVDLHQDATFLWTDPVSVVGFWFALQDATVANGCLWAMPGGHRTMGLHRRFYRSPGGGTAFEQLGPAPDLPAPPFGLVPLEVAAGTLVVLHGLVPHWSAPNTSDLPRDAYSLHVVDGAARYPPDNWLQRPKSLPLQGFAA